ncbi:hypothetical protein VA7868_03506 [Vibrio aerogenes CECT 7868]|uniref:WYL domain-containing protein n=1 Tax=Vibrio aerogenes CECT 7868 TaxID=1216006 RepID=A0A1M6A839_9VIBR|nr:hypothetical protein [Vibrio aerogenes]SHI32589.1 hypothetical protein VA7868_03506 [Vibrio aerogenes CECT 7868]
MLEKIISAINDRKEISFKYSGLSRVAQPAAVGKSLSGNIILRCYQTQGDHIEPGHQWNLCIIDKMQELNITKTTFIENPPGYKPGDSHMCEIFAEL